MAPHRSERGFTLVELLVVIALIGVLAAVVMIAVGGFTNQASNASCEADARALTAAEEAYRATSGGYGDEATLVAAGNLRSESTLHDIELTPASYEVTPVGRCADQVAASPSTTPGDETAKEAAAAAAEPAAMPAAAVSDGTDGWSVTGIAKLTGDGVVFPTEGKATTGAAAFAAPVATKGLHASFVVQVGKGGEGLAFVITDPDAGNPPLGKGGAGLGAAGLGGYAVTFDGRAAKGEPDTPFAGIAATGDGLTYLSTTDLGGFGEWHAVDVTLQGSVLVVAVDGETRLKAEVDLPDSVRVGFTAATRAGGEQQVGKVRLGG